MNQPSQILYYKQFGFGIHPCNRKISVVRQLNVAFSTTIDLDFALIPVLGRCQGYVSLP